MAGMKMPTEAEMRVEFERQHAGRNLGRHSMRGTYWSANIAALWNQHKRTVIWMHQLSQKEEQQCNNISTP